MSRFSGVRSVACIVLTGLMLFTAPAAVRAGIITYTYETPWTSQPIETTWGSATYTSPNNLYPGKLVSYTVTQTFVGNPFYRITNNTGEDFKADLFYFSGGLFGNTVSKADLCPQSQYPCPPTARSLWVFSNGFELNTAASAIWEDDLGPITWADGQSYDLPLTDFYFRLFDSVTATRDFPLVDACTNPFDASLCPLAVYAPSTIEVTVGWSIETARIAILGYGDPRNPLVLPYDGVSTQFVCDDCRIVTTFDFAVDAVPVPEPGSLPLFAAALGVMWWMRRRAAA